MIDTGELPNRFWAKVVAGSGGCWIWTAGCDRAGYANFKAPGGRDSLAHRVSYECLVEPIPVGLEIDHLCRVRNCVNPVHLEPVTHRENVRRSEPATKTHCRRGHPFDEINGRVGDDRRRICRACECIRSREYRRRKRATP